MSSSAIQFTAVGVEIRHWRSTSRFKEFRVDLGSGSSAVFCGPDAEHHAAEYVTAKNSSNSEKGEHQQ